VGRKTTKKTFDTLKQKIVTTPILALPDLQQPFEIETDASGYAMGAVLFKKESLFVFIQKHFLKQLLTIQHMIKNCMH
jgi:hypothetical protein